MIKGMMRTILLLLAAQAWATPMVRDVRAQQRYPWNGLVDIAVTIQVAADELNTVECTFAATNSATLAAVPVRSVILNGSDSITGDVLTRRYIWNAANDVGAVRIDNLALTVDARLMGVQLWEGGPYWAECNVGATKPEEYGYYFWWGDTVGYKRNASNSGWVSVKDGTAYLFSSENCPTYGKGNSQLLAAGYIDGAGNLVAAHDAATAHLGVPWRMPTDAEFDALVSNCTTTCTMLNGVYGRLVTGKGGYAEKSIFLPAAGDGFNSSFYGAGSSGNVWSSTPYSEDLNYSWGLYSLYFYTVDFYRRNYLRYYGQSVRPLRGFAK